MKKILSSLILLLGFSNLTIAATLTVPEEFIVERLNAETYYPSIFTSSTELDLTSGKQILVLSYKEMFDDDSEDHHEYVRSDSFVVVFEVKNETSVTVNFPEQSDLDGAKEFSRAPTVTLLDEDKNALSISIKSLNAFNHDVMEKSININEMAIEENVATIKSSAKGSTKVSSDNKSVDNLAMLKYWWDMASESERKTFKELVSTDK